MMAKFSSIRCDIETRWDMVSLISGIDLITIQTRSACPQPNDTPENKPKPECAVAATPRRPRARPAPSAAGCRSPPSSPGGVGPAQHLSKRNRRPLTKSAEAVEQNRGGHVPRSFWLPHPLGAGSGAGLGQELALATAARSAQTLLAQAAAASWT